MGFDTFFRVLMARWKMIAACFLGAVFLAAIFTMFLPTTYSASTELVVEEKSKDLMSGQSISAGKGYLKTQVDVIKSRNVAGKVWAELDESAREQVLDVAGYEPESGKAPEKVAASYLLSNIEVVTGSGSSIVKIAVESENPVAAAALANATAEAYMKTSLELRTEPARRFSQWYDSQLQQLRNKLATARSSLSEFQKDKGIVAVDERLDVENERLRELTSMLVAAQGRSLEDRTLQSKTQDANWRNDSSDVRNNAVLNNLRSQLSSAEARLRELSVSLGRQHPRFIETQAEISALRSRIATESSAVGRSISNTAELSQTRQDELARAVADQKARVLELTGQRDEMAQLQQEVELAQTAYNQAANRASESQMESQLAETNISVLNPAGIPGRPTGPKVKLNLVIGAALGFLLGIGIALILEVTNRRVRSVSDIENLLGLPVLAYLPSARH